MGLWEWLLARWGDSEEDQKEDESRFVPSPLDQSVRYAHGGTDDELARELTKINDQARELDDDIEDA